jgi:hypothetical protein
MGKRFQLLNSITGWLVFFIATMVYLLTLEPTVSFWDCGEFIAAAFRLEVGHPPGAPFWLLLARFFSFFASDPSHAAKMTNSISALASGLTILFLFWTITHLARKMTAKIEELTTGQTIAILGSGLVGALAYAFSDTFWFSAVESEVYATSSLFTALVFWAILKWEDKADEPGSSRWLILIAYLMGLSIGVHLLNLLAIPAIVFVFYFRKYPVTRKGTIYAVMVSLLLLGTMVYIIIPGVIKVASWFELAFVNGMGMPYNSGLSIYLFLLTTLLVIGLNLTQKRMKVLANTILLGFTMIMIGYSSYAMIIIRSAADPPMDENDPEDVFKLIYYLNREQYGARPLVYGQYYNAPVQDLKEKARNYVRKDGRYEVSYRSLDYVYDKRFLTLFPRMWSSRPEHIQVYKEWGKVKGVKIQVTNRDGTRETIDKPTFGENLRFFFTYQIGHMYGRYFMWNFVGKQNDTQGHGNVINGNWLSGIKFIDNVVAGPQDTLTGESKHTESRNTYYFLPLLLGLAGLLYQYWKSNKNFWVVMLLFLLTGVAIVVYLNQYPYQPRERDYAYAGSFFAFTIWIGLGVLALWEWTKKVLPSLPTAVLVTVLSLVLVPGIMARENWNDHDRSGRYTASDIAFNYLNSCVKNAIIITNGDNDTFPLWYAQEVEGVRTDVRVLNMMLYNTDWYIDQLKMQSYESTPLAISIPREKYKDGTNNQIFIREVTKQPVSWSEVVEWIMSTNPRTKLQTSDGELIDFIPSRTIRIPVNKEKVLASGTVAPELADQIVPYIDVTLKGSYLLKNQFMLLDLIASSQWERPIYFVSGGHEDAMGLEEFFQLEGFAYRLVPIQTKGNDKMLNFGRVDTERLYKNLMETYQWRSINDPKVFLDETNLRTYSVIRIRNKFARLADDLVVKGDTVRAEKVLDKVMEIMPVDRVPYDFYINEIINSYLNCGDKDKAFALAKGMIEYQKGDLNYFFSMGSKQFESIDYETRVALQIFQETLQVLSKHGATDMVASYEKEFNEYYMKYLQKSGAR